MSDYRQPIRRLVTYCSLVLPDDDLRRYSNIVRLLCSEWRGVIIGGHTGAHIEEGRGKRGPNSTTTLRSGSHPNKRHSTVLRPSFRRALETPLHPSHPCQHSQERYLLEGETDVTTYS